jgi:single-stranded-DNA-specific exonuclease
VRSVLREGRTWEVSPLPDEALLEAIQSELACPHPFAVLLARRGGTLWKRLIAPGTQSIHSPFLLPDMEAAVARLIHAIERRERIYIHGDFDVDGLTGAAVLYRSLRPLLPENSVKVEVGERARGHGISSAFVLRAIEEDFRLVVTVDCGIANHEEADRLSEAGIDTIITDHHLPVGDLPNAAAVVDPQRDDSEYPNPHLAGVGVAYKLVCGLYERLGKPAPSFLLDLVALGTIADLVPLTHDGDSENRALVREAFELIRNGKGSALGFRTLMARLSVNPKKITTSDIGYLVAPKLNAANRAGDPKVAFLLLITEARDQAEYLAEILLDYNRDREIAQNDLISQAEEMIRSEGRSPREDGFVFLVGKYWNEGILGLVASSLSDRYRVPAIVLSKGDGVSRGSCRSAGDFDVSACLEANANLLLRYGGHKMAAGFSVANDALERLEAGVEEYIAAHEGDIAALTPDSVDAVSTLTDIDLRFHEHLATLAPFGPGNPRPRFLVHDCSFDGLTLVGNRRQHLKGVARQGGASVPFIAFRMGRYLEAFEEAQGRSLVCQIGFDDWRSAVQVQGVDLVAENAETS